MEIIHSHQQFLVYSQSCETSLLSPEHPHHLKRDFAVSLFLPPTPTLLIHFQSQKTLCSVPIPPSHPNTAHSLSVSTDESLLDVSCKWNHTTCGICAWLVFLSVMSSGAPMPMPGHGPGHPSSLR